MDYTFAHLVHRARILTTPGVRPPRLHDFRHTFAVTTLLEWYRAVWTFRSRLPVLSTWLGHANPASTYWYREKALAPRTARAGRGPARAVDGRCVMSDLAPIMQAFFTDYLQTQLRASGNTVATYRDACRS